MCVCLSVMCRCLCVAVCCGVLQCVADTCVGGCALLQSGEQWCSVVQCGEGCGSVLQPHLLDRGVIRRCHVCVECCVVCCSVLQYVVVCWCVAVCCRVLQLESCRTCKYTRWATAQELASNTATHYNTLQHTATHCNTLQHTTTQGATAQELASDNATKAAFK